MVRIAVVEDEDLYIDQISGYLRQYQKDRGVELSVSLFRDGDEITKDYHGQFDIIFMDVQMKFVNGISAAKEIRLSDPEVIILFITNMKQYAIRGYEVNAMDYVLKPVSYFRFSQKLDKALRFLHAREDYSIVVPVHGGIRKIPTRELYYVESQGHIVNFHAGTEIIETRAVTMKDVEEELTPHGFYCQNKGFLVNMKYVEGIEERDCTVHGEILPVAKAKKKEFMEKFARYVTAGSV